MGTMTVDIREVNDEAARFQISNDILRSLPQWFGIEDSLVEYCTQSQHLPFYAAYQGDKAVGFLSLLAHNSATTEVFVMGVLEPYHRRGIGRALIDRAADVAASAGARMLTVKTLADTHPDKNYARTRDFYTSVGFIPLEVFPELWGADNPCLFLAKPL